MNKKENNKIVYTGKGKSIEENNINNGKLSKRFLIIIHFPKQTDSDLFEYISHLQDFKYCVFQREKSERVTEHISMFLQFNTYKSLSDISSYFPNSFIYIPNSPYSQYIEYCRKEDYRISGPYEIKKVGNFTYFEFEY